MRLFIGIPSRDGKLPYGLTEAKARLERQIPYTMGGVAICSLLAYNFNQILAMALNRREEKPHEKWPGGVTHLLLWHDDIVPTDRDFGIKLLNEMERFNLDAISATVSFRSDSGFTSTARDIEGQPDPVRYKLGDIQGTITSREEPGLLINTGLLLMDLRKPWVESFHWTITDGIRKNADGKFEAVCESEDWKMSRWMRANGVPFGATAKVRTLHGGQISWPNYDVEKANGN